MSAKDKDDVKKAGDLSNPENDKTHEKKKNKAAGRKKDASNPMHLPLLVEFAFSFSLILLILVDLSIVAISYLSGASVLDIALRTTVTTIVLGVVLWLLTDKLARGAIETACSSMFTNGKNSESNGINTEENHTIEA